jgi:hypothetical protein
MLKSTISRVAVSAFAVIVLCHVAKADPVVPVGTVLGGTIIASSQIQQAISGTLQLLDQNGNPVVLGFASQGGMLDFIGSPGTPVVFQAGIAGTADIGNVAINVSFSGTGPVIPNTNAPTLDLIGFATIQFTGFACAGTCLVNPPVFSFLRLVQRTGRLTFHQLRFQWRNKVSTANSHSHFLYFDRA